MPTTSTHRHRPHTPRLLALTLLCVALAACGGPSASITLTLDASSAALLVGDDTVDVDLTVQRVATTADIVLTATGLPTGVTVTFTPDTLAGGATGSVLTLTSSASAPEGTHPITVRATGTGVAAETTLTLTVTSLTVSGVVVGLLDQPIAGVSVAVGTNGPIDITSADGSFDFADVTVPYDLHFFRAADGWAHSFLGLRTASPTVRTASVAFELAGLPQTTVEGTLAAVVPASHRAVVCVQGLDEAVYGCDTVSAGDSNYVIDAVWRTSPIADVRVRAVMFGLDVDGNVTSVTGHVAVDATLEDLVPETVDLTIGAAPATTTLHPTFVVAAGLTLDSVGVAARLSEHATHDVPNVDGATTTPTLVAPSFVGASYLAHATAVGGDGSVSVAWHVGLPNGAAPTIELPAPPAMAAPADGTTGVTTATTFDVNPPTAGLQTFWFSGAMPGSPQFLVTTSADQVRIPDLAAYGLALPGGTSYVWTVLHTPGLTQPDDAVTGAGYYGGFMQMTAAVGGFGGGAAENGAITQTGERTFTTN